MSKFLLQPVATATLVDLVAVVEMMESTDCENSSGRPTHFPLGFTQTLG